MKRWLQALTTRGPGWVAASFLIMAVALLLFAGSAIIENQSKNDRLASLESSVAVLQDGINCRSIATANADTATIDSSIEDQRSNIAFYQALLASMAGALPPEMVEAFRAQIDRQEASIEVLETARDARRESVAACR